MEEKVYDYAIYQKEGSIARVILNRPEKLNVTNMMGTTEGVWTDMHRGLDEAAEDDEVKVVILKGAGRAFTAGEDLSQAGFVYGFGVTKEARRPSQRVRLKILRKFHEEGEKVMFFPKVLIGQGHGYCLGAGSMLLNECDLAIVAEDAVLGYIQERVGGPGLSLTIPLILSVGLKKAKELIYTGKTITGKEAAEIGLVNHAVPADKVEEEVEALAQDIACMSRDGLYIGKAQTEIIYNLLGIGSAFATNHIAHSLFTNLRWEPDEYNLFKERRNKGMRESLHGMHRHFGGDISERGKKEG